MTGQIVHGLSSIVKELIENSIDAKSTCIEVKFRKRGLEGIEVVDNGIGLLEEDYDLFAKIHATSKITGYDEIKKLETYGFRGEAISSICSMSNLTIITKTEKAEFGHRVEYNIDGSIKSKGIASRSRGLSVVVSNILHTLPVRYTEWQRNNKHEFRKALAVVYSYALCCEKTKFICKSDCGGVFKVLFSTQGTGSLLRNIENIYGIKIATALLSFSFSFPEKSLLCTGMVSDVGYARGSTDQQFYFVNKRPVFLLELGRKINKAYREHGVKGYPTMFLEITIPTDKYDINITPDKKTILFMDENVVFSFIEKSFFKFWEERKPSISVEKENKTLFETFSIQKNIQKEKPIEKKQEMSSVSIEKENETLPKVSVQKNIQEKELIQKTEEMSSVFAEKENETLPEASVQSTEKEESTESKQEKEYMQVSLQTENVLKTPVSINNKQVQKTEEPVSMFYNEVSVDTENKENMGAIKKEDISSLCIVGQFNRGFILACFSNGLYVLDQHAVDERINFEKYTQRLKIEQQELIKKIVVNLSIEEEVFVMESIELINKSMFLIEIDEKSPPTKRITIKKVPIIYKHTLLEKDFYEFVDYLRSFTDKTQEPVIPRTNRIIASMACRSSIMIGDVLTREKMRELIKDLSMLKNPWSCPHGRPTVRFLKKI